MVGATPEAPASLARALHASPINPELRPGVASRAPAAHLLVLLLFTLRCVALDGVVHHVRLFVRALGDARHRQRALVGFGGGLIGRDGGGDQRRNDRLVDNGDDAFEAADGVLDGEALRVASGWQAARREIGGRWGGRWPEAGRARTSLLT